MDPQTTNPQIPTAPKTAGESAPILVKIFVVLLAFNMVGAFIGGLLGGGIFLILMGLVILGAIYGLWHMRRWGLYLFTLLSIASVAFSLYSYFTAETGDLLKDFLVDGFQIIALIYLWSIARRFR